MNPKHEKWIKEIQCTFDDFPIYEVTEDVERDRNAAKTTHFMTNGISHLLGDILYWLTDEHKRPNRHPTRADAFKYWGNPSIETVRRVRPQCEQHLNVASDLMKKANMTKQHHESRTLTKESAYRLALVLELLTDGKYSGSEDVAILVT